MSLSKAPGKRVMIAPMIVTSLVILVLIPLSLGTMNGEDLSGESPIRSEPLRISAWTFPWDREGISSLNRWVDPLDEVSPYWYWANANGSVQRTHADAENIDFVTICRKSSVRIVPMVSNNHDPDIVTSICRDPAVQEIHISELMNLTLMFNFDGLDINYESIRTQDRDVYSNFIANLSERLHSRGKVLSVSVFPKVADIENREGPDAYDYPKLASSSDQLRIMAYNLHWSSCPESGPIFTYPWVRTVLEYATSVVPEGKIMLGVPQFSYDWRVNKDGRTLSVAVNRSYSEVMRVMEEYNAPRIWDSSSRTPHIEYRGKDGYLHSLHYCDRESLYHQLKLVDLFSLRGISIWKIGGEDPSSSEMLREVRTHDLGDLPPYIDIGGDIIGKVGTEIALGPVRAYDIEGRLARIEWDLGDGNRSGELEPLHIYSSGGFYNVVLTLEDGSGNSVSESKTVKVGPYADLRIKGDPAVGAIMKFNGTASWDPIGLISYNWDLGDGTYRFHDLPVIEHSYGRPGLFRTSLTVISSEGYVDTAVIELSVPDVTAPIGDAGPDLTVWEDSEVVLDARASWDDSNDLTFEWTISDGRTFQGPLPVLTFERPGTYRAVLEVMDRSGNRDTDDISIIVRDRTPPEISLSYPEIALMGTTIELNASGSRDNVGIEQFIWDLGGGNVLRGPQSISLDILEAKSYFVTLEVLDAERNWNSTTVMVRALDVEPPSAMMTLIPGPVPLNATYLRNNTVVMELTEDERFLGAVLRSETYIFSLSSMTDGSGVAFVSWSFGDGTVAGGPIVYHSYEGSGLYIGKVLLIDIFNNTMAIDFSVLVVPSYQYGISFAQDTNTTYSNTTVHIVPEPIRSPLLETGTIVILMGSLILVAIMAVDIIAAVGSVRAGFRKRREVRRP